MNKYLIIAFIASITLACDNGLFPPRELKRIEVNYYVDEDAIAGVWQLDSVKKSNGFHDSIIIYPRTDSIYLIFNKDGTGFCPVSADGINPKVGDDWTGFTPYKNIKISWCIKDTSYGYHQNYSFLYINSEKGYFYLTKLSPYEINNNKLELVENINPPYNTKVHTFYSLKNPKSKNTVLKTNK